MVAPGTVLKAPHPTETVEVLATPDETSDRYRVRLTAPPGGGSGIRGLGPHVHRGLVEVFRVVDGAMRVRVGDATWDVSDQNAVEVPAGAVHGFVNIGDGPLVVDLDLVFTPPGPRPEADLVTFWVMLDRLIRDGRTSRRTGMPPLPQLAVLLERVPEAFTQPGAAGLLMRPLAMLGRLQGYRAALLEAGQ
jgi:mannose-6-phosphate isomerase-like protein (cupin superfamily)